MSGRREDAARARVVAVTRMVAGSQLRRRWRALAVLALLVGLLSGSAAALVAGSRRSATVVDRYFAAGVPYTAAVYAPWLTDATLNGIDEVRRADLSAYIAWRQVKPDGSLGPGINGLGLDPEGLSNPIFRVLDGRRPNPEATLEVAVNESFVSESGLGVGDEVEVRTFARDQEEEVNAGVYESRGPSYRFEIVGLIRTPSDIAEDEVTSVSGFSQSAAMGVSSRWYSRHRSEFLDFPPGYDVVLDGGPDARSRFTRELQALTPDGAEAAFVGPPPFADRRTALGTPTNLETNALLALGAGVAIVGLLVVVLLLRVEQRGHDDEGSRLRELGVSSTQLGAIAAMRTLPVAVAGSVMGVVIGFAASDRFPIGIGRQLELESGRDVNVAVLALAAIAVMALVPGAAFVFGRASAVAASPVREGGSRSLATFLRRSGVPVEVTTGASFAFASRGTAGQTAAGGAVALAVVVALSMLVAGIDRLHDVPEEHGWAADIAIGNINFPFSQDTAEEIASDDRLSSATITGYGLTKVEGEDVEVLSIQRAGSAPLKLISGRLPETEDEIALGRTLLRRLSADVGSTVVFDIRDGELDGGDATGPTRLRVTGEVLPPPFGETDPGVMGVVLHDTIAELNGNTDPTMVLADLRGDPAVTIKELDAEFTQEAITHILPARFANLHRIRHLPILGGLIAGALGTTVLAYATATTARRRRTELAVLRAIGVTGRQLRRILAWQGLVLGAVILAVGVPLGLAGGNLLWRRIAIDLGAVDRPVYSPRLALLVPAVAAVAAAVGVYATSRSRRHSTATELRAQ